MRKTLVDTDKLNLVGLRPVGNIAMGIADAMHTYTKEQQIIGTAAFFILMCRSLKVSAPEMFNIADRVINSVHDDRPELLAVSEYIDKEMRT